MDITKIPLTGLDMMILCPDATLLKYTDLYNYDNIEDAFKGKNKLVLLYLLNDSHSGHYVGMFYNKNGLNYFDSYGVMPDYQFEMLSRDKRKQLHEEQDYLKQLLKHRAVIYNNITYQDKGTATCGCYVAFRLHNSNFDDQQFFNIFVKSHIRPDKVVAEWCFKRLH